MMQFKLEKANFLSSPLFLVAPFFFLGTSMVVMKAIVPGTTPLFLAGFRLVPAGLIILLITVVAKLPQPKTWQAWGWIALFSVVDGALFQGCLTEGLVHTGAGIGAVLIDAQPLVVAVLSRFLFGELIGFWGWLGLAIGVAGISLCGLPESWILSLLQGDLSFVQSGLSGISVWQLLKSGEFLMLLAALSMSFGTIIIRYVKRHVDAIVATGWHMVLGGLPLFVLSGVGEVNQWNRLDASGWAGLGYATLFGTALTYGIFFYLASVGNLTSVSALIFLTPVFAMLFSSLFLSEVLSSLQWIGVVLTLMSVVLVIQREALGQQFSLWVSQVLPQSPNSEALAKPSASSEEM
jgi:drug/metabolite transporter (DMT)-like permease